MISRRALLGVVIAALALLILHSCDAAGCTYDGAATARFDIPTDAPINVLADILDPPEAIHSGLDRAPARPHSRLVGAGEATQGGASLSVHARGSLSNAAAREFYLEGERGIAAVADDLAARGVPARARALELIQTRNALRTQTRVAMADSDLIAVLNATDSNLTLSQLVSRAYAKGYTGDALWNYLAESASRSRPAVNEAFGLSP